MVHSSSERDFNLVMVESHNSEDVVPSMSNFSDFLTIPGPAAVLRSPAKLRISIKRNFLIVPFSQHSRDLRGKPLADADHSTSHLTAPSFPKPPINLSQVQAQRSFGTRTSLLAQLIFHTSLSKKVTASALIAASS